MTPSFMPVKSISILTTRLVKRSLSMTKRSMVNLNQKLQETLTFFESAWNAEHVNVCYILPYREPTSLLSYLEFMPFPH